MVNSLKVEILNSKIESEIYMINIQELEEDYNGPEFIGTIRKDLKTINKNIKELGRYITEDTEEELGIMEECLKELEAITKLNINILEIEYLMENPNSEEVEYALKELDITNEDRKMVQEKEKIIAKSTEIPTGMYEILTHHIKKLYHLPGIWQNTKNNKLGRDKEKETPKYEPAEHYEKGIAGNGEWLDLDCVKDVDRRIGEWVKISLIVGFRQNLSGNSFDKFI